MTDMVNDAGREPRRGGFCSPCYSAMYRATVPVDGNPNLRTTEPAA